MDSHWSKLSAVRPSLQKRINALLNSLPERNFWSLSDSSPDFTSNDYLGLIHDGVISEILAKVPSQWLRGSGASRYLGGDAEPFHTVEILSQQLWGMPGERALFFPSGLTANLAFWSAVPHRDDTILYDREIHASIRQGMRLSGATLWSFPHNDWDAAEKKLRKARGDRFLVVESLYSMRGTSPDPAALTYLQARYECHLIVDEAHTTLVWGDAGSWSATVGLKPLARLFTFGKAVGLVGAVWIAPEWLIAYLKRIGFAGIYTTALPPLIPWAVSEILRRSDEWHPRRLRLLSLIAHTREALQQRHVPFSGLAGPIALLPAHVGPLPLKKLFPPTVAAPAYRLSLHAHNTPQEIEALLEHI